MCRIAMLSVHGCPLARLGTREAGGMQAYVRSLSRELGRRGMIVDVFTRRSDPELPEVVPFGPNARVIHVTAGEPAPIEKSALFEVLPEFICNVQRFRRAEGLDYHFVHSHYWLSGWVGSHLARRWEAPHVTMFHTLARLKGQALPDDQDAANRAEVEGRIVASADRIIASSEQERVALVERYGARRDRVEVIPCGVDLDIFRPGDRDAARARLDLDGEVLLFVGRMDPIKGIDLLLRAVALLRVRPSLTLAIAGGSGAEAEMRRTRALAGELGLGGIVQFRGSVLQEDLADYYRAASVTVVPSHYESFGLVPLESLACGTPVVGSAVGGLPTIIRDGENGLLVPWRTPAAFATAIARALDDARLRTGVAERARSSVLRFGWPAVAERVLRLYRAADWRAPALACLDSI